VRLVAVAALLLLAACSSSAKNSASTQTENPKTDATTTAPVVESSANGTTTKKPKRPSPPPAQVYRVIDGDTIDLDNGDRIRLVQIDAPEASGECYGQKAGTVLRRLLPVGTKVRAARDPLLDNIDRYARQLRYVFRGQMNINLVLVQRGAASVWFYSGDRGRYADELLAAAHHAKGAKRGAWGACTAKLDPLHAFTTIQKRKQSGGASGTNGNCDPNYTGACLKDGIGDYDCLGGSGDGPNYVQGPIRVVGADSFRLDGDGDGIACESG
jgi:endonuclease YncB( thermonuclease family)